MPGDEEVHRSMTHPSFIRVLARADAAMEARVQTPECQIVPPLREIVHAAQLAVIGSGDTSQALIDESEKLGWWMSAALDDKNVCAEMKSNINAWFVALENFNNVRRIAAALPKAYAQVYAEMPFEVKPTTKRNSKRGVPNAKRRKKRKA
jgi:hypothetical protein